MFQEIPTHLQKRIDAAVELAREVSAQTDPQEMVRRYRKHARRARPVDASISLSRRDLHAPYYRITRWSGWPEEINPWKEKDRLPLLKGGLLADLIYGDQPRVISDLVIDPDEPAADYLQGMRSLLALPLYENGLSLNMVILSMEKPGAIDLESIPELIVTGNLFGRATYNLVMADRAREAYNALDAEFKTIARIQQCLLPASLPKANGIDLAAYYATAHRAGGDYYDVFPLDNGRSGILIADVSGHGAAAAVVMARMHAALHSGAANMDSPAEVLSFANDHLLLQCRTDPEVTTFVTSFYAVFDPGDTSLLYASAGHNPPRLRCADGCMCSIAGARSWPLGIQCGVQYEQDRLVLGRYDHLLLYTDGIVEATNTAGDQFGVDRLDRAVLQPHDSARTMVGNVVTAVDAFTRNTPAMDDRTLLALRVR